MSETNQKKTGRKKKRIVRKIILTLVILLILGAAGLYTWARLRAQYTVVYDEYTATTGTISNSLSFSGSLALKDSKTYSADSSTTVRTIYVREGDRVRKGDRLIRLGNGTTLTADFDATVNVISVEKDDDVMGGDNLIQIADFEHMQVSFRVDEYDISDVSVGEEVTVTATATEKVFRSKVESINYISSSQGNVAYYTALANVDVDGGVFPGMQVTVTVPQEEAVDVVVLKADALSFNFENQAFVYVKDEKDVLQQKNVEVGVSNGNYVEIRTGLASGDRVYAVSKKTQDSLNAAFSGMFGQQTFNQPGGNRQNWNRNAPSGSGGTRPSGNSTGGNGGGR